MGARLGLLDFLWGLRHGFWNDSFLVYLIVIFQILFFNQVIFSRKFPSKWLNPHGNSIRLQVDSPLRVDYIHSENERIFFLPLVSFLSFVEKYCLVWVFFGSLFLSLFFFLKLSIIAKVSWLNGIGMIFVSRSWKFNPPPRSRCTKMGISLSLYFVLKITQFCELCLNLFYYFPVQRWQRVSTNYWLFCRRWSL